MHSLNDAIAEVFSDHDILPSDVPQLDLYMDQILSLFEQGLRDSKRDPSDKLLTKTMVNNYVKEGLVNPVRGKNIPGSRSCSYCASTISSKRFVSVISKR